MKKTADILCIGSVLWDVIGRSASVMRQGSDVPGRITRLPGGVAMNIAMTLARFGLTPALLTAIGRDAEGDELMAACAARGMITDTIYRSDDLPTDRYMAVEGANGLIAAIADAHSLEAAGAKILRPLTDGTLPAPYSGLVALDGNLTLDLLAEIARCRIAPASASAAPDAAAALLKRGAARVLVTNGGHDAAEGDATGGVIHATPPQVLVTRVTGAGDTFMAAHIAAEARGADRHAALAQALEAAAIYVSGDTPN